MPRPGGAPLRTRILMLVCAAALALGAVPARAAAADVPQDRYGVTDSYLRAVNPAARRLGLGLLYAGGVRLMRSDVSWAAVEPSPPGADGVHHYDWARNDQWVAELAQAGLRLYPLVGYSAPWASTVPSTWDSHPRDPAQYAAFAAAVAARYGPTGSFWAEHPELPRLPAQSVEVWNEENAAQFWLEQATAPADYAQLYLAARGAVHRVAPDMEVVVGGLVDNGAESFLRRMFAAAPALAGNVDAVGYHAYLLSPADAVGRIASVRRTLDALGARQAGIQLTEVGWSVLEADDEQRGANLAAISRLTTDPALNVTKVIAFAAMSNEGDPQQWDQWFGLLNHDGTPKLTFLRWAAEIAALKAQGVAPRLVIGTQAARASGGAPATRAARRTSRARAAKGRAAARAARRAAVRGARAARLRRSATR